MSARCEVEEWNRHDGRVQCGRVADTSIVVDGTATPVCDRHAHGHRILARLGLIRASLDRVATTARTTLPAPPEDA